MERVGRSNIAEVAVHNGIIRTSSRSLHVLFSVPQVGRLNLMEILGRPDIVEVAVDSVTGVHLTTSRSPHEQCHELENPAE